MSWACLFLPMSLPIARTIKENTTYAAQSFIILPRTLKGLLINPGLLVAISLAPT